jgi:hypothetical protein
MCAFGCTTDVKVTLHLLQGLFGGAAWPHPLATFGTPTRKDIKWGQIW